MSDWKKRALLPPSAKMGALLDTTPNELAALRAENAALVRDKERLDAAQKYLVAGTFEWPGYEGHSCLVLALPKGTQIGIDLRGDLDAAMREET